VSGDTGLSDISGSAAKLSRLNYQGFLQIEHQGVDHPRIALKHNVAYVRGLLARLAPTSGASRHNLRAADLHSTFNNNRA
jgi:hypothetical protein